MAVVWCYPTALQHIVYNQTIHIHSFAHPRLLDCPADIHASTYSLLTRQPKNSQHQHDSCACVYWLQCKCVISNVHHTVQWGGARGSAWNCFWMTTLCRQKTNSKKIFFSIELFDLMAFFSFASGLPMLASSFKTFHRAYDFWGSDQLCEKSNLNTLRMRMTHDRNWYIIFGIEILPPLVRC